ncbi:MAG: hypothetical protein J5I98_32915 [Phaeodactylibacter sp.]|nr:hypothetical protein [Phaeodactylibacter sp.]
MPFLSHIIILAIDNHWEQVLYTAAMLWGLAYTCIQVTALPYILLNARKETHSEAIAMSFLSFSVTICLVGVANFLLNQVSPAFFTEKCVLQMVASFSLLGIFFVTRIRVPEKLSARMPLQSALRGYDWGLIFRALIPTVIIAVGAGFTIPVINLFFLNVHGLPSKLFSLVGSETPI